jgi:hypothetical protein
VLGRFGGGAAAGDPGDQGGEPHVADDPGDRDVVVGDLAAALGVHGVGQHAGHQHPHVVDLGGHGGVGEHEGPGERLGEMGITLHAASRLLEHADHAVGGGVARHRLAAHRGLGLLERPAQGRDQQVDLGREVAVEGAERDVGAVGDRPHLDGVEAPVARQLVRRVENPLATIALGRGPQVVDRQRVGAAHKLSQVFRLRR